MQTLRRALGDDGAGACGRCDLCDGRAGDALDARDAVDAAGAFLARRVAPIDGFRAPRMAAGVSVLDGELRPPLHVRFLRERGDAARPELPPELLEMVLARARELAVKHRFGGVVAVPSRTWAQRTHAVTEIARAVGCLPFPDVLTFSPAPLHPQGALRNNDQRRENVRDCIYAAGELGSSVTGPARKDVLLVDDFVGSRATLREAVRILRRDAGVRGEIVPLTITRVRWRLGAPGMV